MSSGLRAFLQQALSNSAGGRSVPYTEITKSAIEEQLVNLQEIFPTLGITVDEFCTNDGRVLNLLKADGTIPVHFQGNKYNIPVTIWLTEEYPVEAPIVFVVPTQDMIIKPGHPQVNSSGQAFTPSLCNWSPSNNLVDLAFELSEYFGRHPPLYAKPPAPPAASSSGSSARPSPPPPPPPSYAPPPVLPPTSSAAQAVPPPPGYPGVPPAPYVSSGMPIAGAQSLPWGLGNRPPPPPPSSSYPMSSNPIFPVPTSPPAPTSMPPTSGPLQPPPPPALANTLTSHPIWGPAFVATAQPPQPPQPPTSAALTAATSATPPPPPPLASTLLPPQPPPALPVKLDEVNARFKALAVAGLLPQLQAAEACFTEQAALETDELLETQRNLADRRRQLDAIVRGLKQEREGTEGLVKEMGSKSVQLQQWLDRNKPKADALQASGGIDWDAVIVPTDAVSQQAIGAQAEDHALEDTILALDKAFHAGLAGFSLDAYLKQMRALCRRQFFVRALGIKASEALQQRQPSHLRAPSAGAGIGQPMLANFVPLPSIASSQPPPPPPPPPQPPLMVPTQVLGAAGTSRLPQQLQQQQQQQQQRQTPVPPSAPSTNSPMQPVTNPVISRPFQSRPIQPYPKVQR